MAKTMREKFIAALTDRGETSVKHTGRYDVYTNADGGFFYVGTHGSLRVGPNIAKSIPVSDERKRVMLQGR